jgi:aspartyl aminopeptidase
MPDTDPVDDLLAYIERSPTPWHAVAETVRRLEDAGYRPLDERERWSVSPGDKVYVVRGGSSVAAFELGSGPPSDGGFCLVGAHTDSPNLRLKPNPQSETQGMQQLAVEPYGGVLWHTWLDRDLSIAGRVLVRGEGGPRPVLVRFDRPMARVPSIAIHLDRTVNEEGLKLNAQEHLAPLFSLDDTQVLERVAEAAGARVYDILGFDLCLYDVVPPARGGANGELLFAPRLDNLASCHAGLSALLSAEGPATATRGVVFYDHEECGSTSPQGADSPFLPEVLERLARATDDASDAFARALSRSFMLSADMAHAVHPNYASKHEPQHMPKLGAGPVIKTNVNQRYATDGESAARFTSWCARADVVPQQFVTRSDLACGSTIGPISAGRLGMRTIDVGNPMLSMHSARELAGAADVAPMIAVMRVFYESDD